MSFTKSTARVFTYALSCGVAGSTVGASPVQNDQWTELSYKGKYDDTHHFVYNSMWKEGVLEQYKLSLAPDRQTLHASIRLGDEACGHPKFVHGGAIATVFDDCMGSLFFAARYECVYFFRFKVHAVYRVGNGFTAKLETNYRHPIPAGTNVKLIASVQKVDGRKVWLQSKMVDEADESILYAEATALFVTKNVKSRPLALEGAEDAMRTRQE